MDKENISKKHAELADWASILGATDEYVVQTSLTEIAAGENSHSGEWRQLCAELEAHLVNCLAEHVPDQILRNRLRLAETFETAASRAPDILRSVAEYRDAGITTAPLRAVLEERYPAYPAQQPVRSPSIVTPATLEEQLVAAKHETYMERENPAFLAAQQSLAGMEGAADYDSRLASQTRFLGLEAQQQGIVERLAIGAEVSSEDLMACASAKQVRAWSSVYQEPGERANVLSEVRANVKQHADWLEQQVALDASFELGGLSESDRDAQKSDFRRDKQETQEELYMQAEGRAMSLAAEVRALEKCGVDPTQAAAMADRVYEFDSKHPGAMGKLIAVLDTEKDDWRLEYARIVTSDDPARLASITLDGDAVGLRKEIERRSALPVQTFEERKRPQTAETVRADLLVFGDQMDELKRLGVDETKAIGMTRGAYYFQRDHPQELQKLVSAMDRSQADWKIQLVRLIDSGEATRLAGNDDASLRMEQQGNKNSEKSPALAPGQGTPVFTEQEIADATQEFARIREQARERIPSRELSLGN